MKLGELQRARHFPIYKTIAQSNKFVIEEIIQ